MNVYEQLGVRTLINARGTNTRLGGTIILREVVEAMVEASRYYANLDELHEKAGEVVARVTGAEAGYITAGAAAGLVIATTACVVGKDTEKLERLPNTAGMKNEVIIPKAHRNGYDYAVRQVGVTLVEVDAPQGASAEEIEGAINERTAAILYVYTFSSRGGASLQEVVAVGKRRGIPVIVDAAAELPPASNLTKLAATGADLITFSGGKGIMGPQNAGILCGRKDLIEACALFSNPNHGMGRPMKVGKEEIIGLVTALELYEKRDHKADLEEWERQVQHIVDALSDVPHVEAGLMSTTEQDPMPYAYVRLDEQALGMTTKDLIEQLQEGTPRIEVRTSSEEIGINPHTLQAGEERIIAERLKEVLTGVG